MVAAKPQDADRIAAKPPAGVGFYLVYGPDTGSVSERAGRIARTLADESDPFSLIRLDAAQLSSDPSRLADEAYAVSMFGGRRAIWLKDGGRANLAALLAPLLADPPPETAIVVEAGDLKKSHALRTMFERDRTAYAIPCYIDDDAAVARLVDEETRAHGLSIAPDAKAALVAHLGNDRLVSRGEIQKLCLFALGRERIELADVEALVGDSGGVALDEIIDAAAIGAVGPMMEALKRAFAEGNDPGQLAGQALRHFQALEAARPEVDAGRNPGEVVETMRPPVFFKRKKAVVDALGLWSTQRLQRISAALAEAVRDARLNAGLAEAIVTERLLSIALSARSSTRR